MAPSPKLQNQVERAVREALIASIREDRSLTVDRLIALRKDYAEVGTITMGELLDGVPGRAAEGRSNGVRGGRGRGGRKSQAIKAASVDTRSATGRDAYDKSVLAILKSAGGKKVSAQTIRREVGGTPEQARRALNRLIDSNGVQYTGQARATRYWVK